MPKRGIVAWRSFFPSATRSWWAPPTSAGRDRLFGRSRPALVGGAHQDRVAEGKNERQATIPRFGIDTVVAQPCFQGGMPCHEVAPFRAGEQGGYGRVNPL